MTTSEIETPERVITIREKVDDTCKYAALLQTPVVSALEVINYGRYIEANMKSIVDSLFYLQVNIAIKDSDYDKLEDSLRITRDINRLSKTNIPVKVKKYKPGEELKTMNNAIAFTSNTPKKVKPPRTDTNDTAKEKLDQQVKEFDLIETVTKMQRTTTMNEYTVTLNVENLDHLSRLLAEAKNTVNDLNKYPDNLDPYTLGYMKGLTEGILLYSDRLIARNTNSTTLSGTDNG